MVIAFDNPKAFDPFFDDHVSVEAVRAGRTVRTTCAACVLDEGYDDPLSDAVQTSRRIVTVLVRGGECFCFGGFKPGDVVVSEGSRLAVERASLSHGVWEARCRAL